MCGGVGRSHLLVVGDVPPHDMCIMGAADKDAAITGPCQRGYGSTVLVQCVRGVGCTGGVAHVCGFKVLPTPRVVMSHSTIMPSEHPAVCRET